MVIIRFIYELQKFIFQMYILFWLPVYIFHINVDKDSFRLDLFISASILSDHILENFQKKRFRFWKSFATFFYSIPFTSILYFIEPN